jgi:uridine kinase
MTPERMRCLERLARVILEVDRPHPVRVAIDGPDAAGKTVLADQLAPILEVAGRPVIRASIDGFHRPRAQRLERGAESPEGYFRDSFDYAALRAALLEPLGPGGDARYRRRVFDYRTDERVESPIEVALPDSILLFDGVFLLRRELNEMWDFSIFVAVPFAETRRRAAVRDLDMSPRSSSTSNWSTRNPGRMWSSTTGIPRNPVCACDAESRRSESAHSGDAARSAAGPRASRSGCPRYRWRRRRDRCRGSP